MNPNQTLEKILTDYGRTVLQNPRQVENLFKDLCYEPEHKREVNVLILALKENIPDELINNQPINDMLVMRLIKKLDDTYFIPAQQAQSAIETWAKALNIALPNIAIQKPILQTPTQQIITPVQSDNERDEGGWNDPRTGVMWARISIGQEWINGQCVGEAEKLNWEDAKKECQNFQLAGFNDWRLPTIDELKTLSIEGGKTGYNCPNQVLFKPTYKYGNYWSSSSSSIIDKHGTAWLVYFYNGCSDNDYKNSINYVRAVRSTK